MRVSVCVCLFVCVCMCPTQKDICCCRPHCHNERFITAHTRTHAHVQATVHMWHYCSIITPLILLFNNLSYCCLRSHTNTLTQSHTHRHRHIDSSDNSLNSQSRKYEHWIRFRGKKAKCNYAKNVNLPKSPCYLNWIMSEKIIQMSNPDETVLKEIGD